MKLKTLLFCLSFFAISYSYGQDFSLNDKGQLIIRDTISVEGMDKTRLYDNTKAWLAKEYKSRHNKVVYGNQKEGNIICEGQHFYNRKVLYYDLEMWLVDNQVVLVFDDFKSGQTTMAGYTVKEVNQLLRKEQASLDRGGLGTKRVRDIKKEIILIRNFFYNGLSSRYNEVSELGMD